MYTELLQSAREQLFKMFVNTKWRAERVSASVHEYTFVYLHSYRNIPSNLPTILSLLH